ncbi:MAG TPA: hypothetical protein VFA52_00710 [Candidatus Paceibacterota bacterium]|nr:hypothetical protein [Candidatus Paceibacterota bacterium]
MQATTDHEVIKNWILKWGGTPAIGGDSEDGSGKGILRIIFGDNSENAEPIGWEEFFDIFEADRLTFRCNNDVVKGSEFLSFTFVDRDKSAPLKEDETSLPEINKMAEENMYDNFETDQSY